MQALFLTDAFVWRIYDFSLKLKAEPTKMDEEDFEFGKKVVELLQKLFAKMALTKHKHTDILGHFAGISRRLSPGRATRCD